MIATSIGNSHGRRATGADVPGRGAESPAGVAKASEAHRQLDVLVFEGFYGGGRRTMLESIARCSRHRWNVLKLPARRIERRLMVAATWFAEYLSRNEVGHVDVIFTSEALNLADLYRLAPTLAHTPAVVYFHDTQLPGLDARRIDTPTDLVNLNSAMAASEIWFNSLYNLRQFLSRASAMVGRHRELQVRNPLPQLTAKAHLVPPPVDMTLIHDLAAQGGYTRDPRSVLIDSRGADPKLIVKVLQKLEKRNERIRVSLIGQVKGVSDSKVTFLTERDDSAHLRGLIESATIVTARADAPADDLIVRALAAGCHPIVPDSGVYPELLPRSMHARCLHERTPESICKLLTSSWQADYEVGDPAADLAEVLEQHDAIRACRVIDDRLAGLVRAAHGVQS